MSTKRTIVHLVAAEPVSCAEPADLGLHLVLLCLQSAELPLPAGQAAHEADDQRAHRRITFRRRNPRVAVDVIGY